MICYEFYFVERDRFTINNDHTFEYKKAKRDHVDGYYILGERRLDREVIDEYKWRIETTESYVGRFGIIDDTDHASLKLTQGSDGGWLWERKDVIIVGTENKRWIGNHFGKWNDKDLTGFVVKDGGDIVDIHLNYTKNIVSFESLTSNKKVEKELKEGVNIVRFVAEFIYNDATMWIL